MLWVIAFCFLSSNDLKWTRFFWFVSVRFLLPKQTENDFYWYLSIPVAILALCHLEKKKPLIKAVVEETLKRFT